MTNECITGNTDCTVAVKQVCSTGFSFRNSSFGSFLVRGVFIHSLWGHCLHGPSTTVSQTTILCVTLTCAVVGAWRCPLQTLSGLLMLLFGSLMFFRASPVPKELWSWSAINTWKKFNNLLINLFKTTLKQNKTKKFSSYQTLYNPGAARCVSVFLAKKISGVFTPFSLFTA